MVTKSWNRDEQTYWISRRDWKVIDMKTSAPIADYPRGCHDMELMEKVCFANSVEEVNKYILEFSE